MGLFGIISFAIGTSFLMVGAWPVFGFFGADVLLLYGAFRMSYRDALLHERITLSDDAIQVLRTEPNGREQRWEFPAYWARVLMDNPPTESSELVLATHGRRLTVGAFLAPEERAELADVLRRAIDKFRARPSEAPRAEPKQK
jgi:uncharacterized membrane protein